ncbi:hypothetical protein [Actinoplanes sp. CA-252034]|uniref:hypothetical protein n=1 Tax=Actinoplanes sp. CA-252034 TaxID=3239906 RepID=UPI003D97157A
MCRQHEVVRSLGEREQNPQGGVLDQPDPLLRSDVQGLGQHRPDLRVGMHGKGVELLVGPHLTVEVGPPQHVAVLVDEPPQQRGGDVRVAGQAVPLGPGQVAVVAQ